MINEDSWKGMDDVTSKDQNPDSCMLTLQYLAHSLATTQTLIEISFIATHLSVYKLFHQQIHQNTNTVIVLGFKSFSPVIMCLAGACE